MFSIYIEFIQKNTILKLRVTWADTCNNTLKSWLRASLDCESFKNLFLFLNFRIRIYHIFKKLNLFFLR